MKKIFLIYNPVSGKGTFKNKLDFVMKNFQEHDYIVTPYRLAPKEIAEDVISKIDPENYDIIVAAGGDGTLNSVVAGLVQHQVNLPLGIIPMGTSNDFANHLGIPKRIDYCIRTIIKGNSKYVDIGQVNGSKSFINVVSGGNLPSIAHNTNVTFKNNLGKLAYYINVLGQYPVFQPFRVKITTNGEVYNEEALLFFVLNSPCAGGFKSLAPKAKVDDGKFDVVLIKNCKFPEKLSLFMKILKGMHHNDEYVLYLQTKELIVECDDNVETDIDGERGPAFPMEIKCKKTIRVYC